MDNLMDEGKNKLFPNDTEQRGSQLQYLLQKLQERCLTNITEISKLTTTTPVSLQSAFANVFLLLRFPFKDLSLTNIALKTMGHREGNNH